MSEHAQYVCRCPRKSYTHFDAASGHAFALRMIGRARLPQP